MADIPPCQREAVHRFMARCANMPSFPSKLKQTGPAITRVMVEWCDVTSGLGCDKENAQTLAQAVGELTRAFLQA
jgi:hypothetical protein